VSSLLPLPLLPLQPEPPCGYATTVTIAAAAVVQLNTLQSQQLLLL
jgi:hypothetical protein